MKKNVASQLVSAQLNSVTAGTAVTTGTCNVAVEIDGAAGTGGTATHIANGKWEYAPIQADTNGDYLTFQFVLSGAIIQTVQIYTTSPQTGDSFARLGAPAGASVSADIAAIEAQTDDIGAAGAGLTAVPWNAAWAAQVNAEVDTALADIHLDHLFAVDYDPASKPGTATGLLNELVEDDSGESRFTVNALENGPSGSGSSPATIADAVWDEARSGHTTAGTFGEHTGDAAMRGTDSAYTGTPPTANENADALLTRDWTSVTGEAARSVLNALRFLRNKWSIGGTTLTVTEEDDTTTAWTAELTPDSSANPITSSDPS